MRPLLRLSLLLCAAALSVRAAEVHDHWQPNEAQTARLTKTSELFKSDPLQARARAAEADQTVASACQVETERCLELRSFHLKLKDFAAQTPAYTASGFEPKAVEERYKTISLMARGIFDLEGKHAVELDPFLFLFTIATFDYGKAIEDVLSSESKTLDADLTVLEARTKELEAAPVLPAPKNLPLVLEVEGLKKAQLKAFDKFKALSQGIDAYYTPWEKTTMKQRETANGQAVLLADLRDRLIALQARLGLTPSPGLDLSWDRSRKGRKLAELVKLERKKNIGKDMRLPSANVFLPAQPPAQDEGLTPAAAEKELVSPQPPQGQNVSPTFRPPEKGDLELSPPPAPAKEPVSKPGLWDKPLLRLIAAPFIRAAAPFARVKAKIMLWTGQAEVEGEARKRAVLVHRQWGPTCGVVAQQQMLTAYGLLDGTMPHTNERNLRDEASEKGFYRDGTPVNFTGNLLLEHGLLVVKHAGASDEQLAAAAKTGKILLVNVDTGYFWNKASFVGQGHTVIITGIEVAREGGRVLGYFVNDSGTGKGGRFIPIKQFLRAWHAGGKMFIEAK